MSNNKRGKMSRRVKNTRRRRNKKRNGGAGASASSIIASVVSSGRAGENDSPSIASASPSESCDSWRAAFPGEGVEENS